MTAPQDAARPEAEGLREEVAALRQELAVARRQSEAVARVAALVGEGLDLATIDLILLDRHLPDISGDEVFRILREDPDTRDVPIVILSDDAIPGRVRRLLDAGVQAYLTKPLDVRSLLATVASIRRPAS